MDTSFSLLESLRTIVSSGLMSKETALKHLGIEVDDLPPAEDHSMDAAAYMYAGAYWATRSAQHWAQREQALSGCAYCGSRSPDDRRGNCLACGGPRCDVR